MDQETSPGAPDRPEAPLPSPLDQLPETSVPATRALTAAGYTSLRSLAGVPRAELLRLHGVGPKALRILDEELSRHGLGLG